MKGIFNILIPALIYAVFLASCTQTTQQANEQKPAPLSQEELIKKGEYLVNTIGCHDCHSAKRMGPHGPEIIPELALAGYPSDRPNPQVDMSGLNPGWGVFNEDLTSFIGPWGQSFAANITSHESGVGGWSQEQFNLAMKEGWFRGIEGSRRLLPPMPWENFSQMTDEDLEAILAYLQSTPPVKNEVPDPIPPAGQ